MEADRQYFSGEELQEQIAAINWVEFAPILYAMTRRMMYKRFLSDPERGVYGKTFKDYVHDAITLCIEEKRRWPKDIKKEQYYITTIRSLISNQIRKHIMTLSVDATEEEVLAKHYESMNVSFDVAKIKRFICNKLGSDQICIDIFDCWSEGIHKPAEIRELYGYTDSEYNNAKKRLDRVLVDMRNHLKNE